MMKINRRNFLKLSAVGVGALLLPKIKTVSGYLPEFPTGEKLGRCFYTVDVLTKPDSQASVVKTLFQDNVVNIYREVLGTNDSRIYRSKTWYETDDGFIYAPNVQPVKNLPNLPIETLPTYESTPGFWAEVTVPYVDLQLEGENPNSPLLQELITNQQTPRFYYSQVLWVDNVKTGDFGELLYHALEKHGSYGDTFWADSRAFKPLTPEDLSPINPDVTDKRIVVDVDHQSLSCYEGTHEVLYSIVSTGAKSTFGGQTTDAWATPVGDYYAVNRKFISLHMAGGDSKASGYEEFAVSYTSIFATGGISFHSTYWHNSWGSSMSHGCVNMKPEEAKFVYRWTQPGVPYTDGKYEQEGYAGTKVQVVEY